jgi:type I restriction enzyme M protein
MPKRHRPGRSAVSVLSHIEELVLATSGEDAFELVFALAAARVTSGTVASVRRAHPELGIPRVHAPLDRELERRVDALLARVMPSGDGGASLEGLDAIFEALVPRIAKGDKGQFFTPRHVVDFVVRALAPTARDVVVDPACGSGAFLSHAGRAKTFGCDVDGRAIRVARLVALAQGRDPATLVRADGLRTRDLPAASIVATNPPFAGRAPAQGFEVAELVRTPERDVLFLERAVGLLRPGGRLAIVLPYNKAAGAAYAAVRRWLASRVRVFAVVGLPRETFLPHTSQRTFVLFAKRRRAREAPDPAERMMFMLSERAGKDAAGDASGAHDLDEVLAELSPFLASEGFAS